MESLKVLVTIVVTTTWGLHLSYDDALLVEEISSFDTVDLDFHNKEYKCVFLTKALSSFATVDLKGFLGPPRLATAVVLVSLKFLQLQTREAESP